MRKFMWLVVFVSLLVVTKAHAECYPCVDPSAECQCGETCELVDDCRQVEVCRDERVCERLGRNCGEKNDEDANFCDNCGQPL